MSDDRAAERRARAEEQQRRAEEALRRIAEGGDPGAESLRRRLRRRRD